MRIMTFNTRKSSGGKIPIILEQVNEHTPDILVLTEFRENSKANLWRKALSERGFTCNAVASIEKNVNTVFIASKMPFVPCVYRSHLGDDCHRLVVARFAHFVLAGVCFAKKTAKRRLFNYINNRGESLGDMALILGNFSTGLPYLDEKGKTFSCVDEFKELENFFTDSWRSRNPDSVEYSWYSEAGNGFRVDHAFATPRLNTCIEKIFYSHKERDLQLSDHSPLIVDLDFHN